MLDEKTRQKLILSLLGIETSHDAVPCSNGIPIGKTCMFRTYSAGVHFGELVEKEGKECLIKNAKRVYNWTEACSLSQLAMEGSKSPESCKISMPVDTIILTEVIEIIPMRKEAIDSLGKHVWKK